ncbi:hypothetical protein BBJ28_00002655 [Nothophytophthora sp. Chile5]|nr:hypothetical protein BBJ28_00002655 [Nothophytophthora sp. Chile5]
MRAGCALAASLVVLTAPAPVGAMILKLDGSVEECFHEYVRTKRTAFMKIGVLDSTGSYDVRLKAFGPFPEYPEDEKVEKNFFDQLIVTPHDDNNQNIEHSGFNFESEHRGGWYRFCLDNTHDRKARKTVEFYTSFDLSNEEDLGEEDKLDEQARQAIESSKSRIMWYTAYELGVLGAMYGAQSFLLHKWFSDRGYLSKRQWA